jgi:epoxyqueuosine reductase
LHRHFAFRSVRPPVASRIARWFDRHTCQDVCPWNAKISRAATEPAFKPRDELVAPDIAAIAAMDDAEFKRRFGDTPLSRAKRAGIQRNTASVVRNTSPTGEER